LYQFLKRITRKKKPTRGQSFVELALILPILLLMLLGLVEVSFFIGRYLDVLDLSREAARFASVRDPFSTGDLNCSTTNDLNFFYDTSCMMSPPADLSASCTNAQYCNGFNPYLTLDLSKDDVVITAFTISGNNISDQYPHPNGYWALSNVDFAGNADLNLTNGTLPDNFKKDCEGNVIRSDPHYTASRVQSLLLSAAPANKGYVAVEVYYCYEQVLGIPIITDFIPNPLQIRAYTIMPLPAAQPTPTPIP
jgi:hypothetical protein